MALIACAGQPLVEVLVSSNDSLDINARFRNRDTMFGRYMFHILTPPTMWQPVVIGCGMPVSLPGYRMAIFCPTFFALLNCCGVSPSLRWPSWDCCSHRRGPKGSNLRWLFHYWLLGSAIFYGFGAQELVINIWNFHIVDPALAGLSAQGLLVAVAALARFRLSLIGRVALILAIVTRHGFELSHLGWVYAAHARQSYEMGAALARLSRPYDLVITVANSIGDPVAIYYSRRRGWVFPPPWPGVDWAQDIVDEPAAIQLFDRLRSEGAKWFGIVAPQRINFSQTTPRLMKHIESTTELVEEDRDWAIYRISPPSK